jgi:hypothetical protein
MKKKEDEEMKQAHDKYNKTKRHVRETVKQMRIINVIINTGRSFANGHYIIILMHTKKARSNTHTR